MQWSTKYPTLPGYYLVQEQDEEPTLVQVDVVDDSHDMFYILIPGDRRKYPLELWKDAFWYGPISSMH